MGCWERSIDQKDSTGSNLNATDGVSPETGEDIVRMEQAEFRVWNREHGYSEGATGSIWARLVESSFAVNYLERRFPSAPDAPKFPDMQHYEYRQDKRFQDLRIYDVDANASHGLDLTGLVNYMKWSLSKINEAAQISTKATNSAITKLLPPGIGPGKIMQLVGFLDEKLGQDSKISDLLPLNILQTEEGKQTLPDAYKPNPKSAFLTHGRVTRDGLVLYAMDQAERNGEINPRHSVERSWPYITGELADIFEGMAVNNNGVCYHSEHLSAPATKVFKILKRHELRGTKSGLSLKAYNRLVGLLIATNTAE